MSVIFQCPLRITNLSKIPNTAEKNSAKPILQHFSIPNNPAQNEPYHREYQKLASFCST